MKTQDKDERTLITGAHIAPKGHASGCACCTPEDDALDDDA